MKKIITFITLLLCASGGFTSCKEKEENGSIDDIIGTWKLMEVILPFTPTGPFSYDYSQYNVVYDFKSDTTLIVSENIANIDVHGYGHESGKHYYTTIKDESGCYVLKIDNNHNYWYRVSSNKLIFDNSPLDGPKYYFVKHKIIKN